jgi:hypothetical protein
VGAVTLGQSVGNPAAWGRNDLDAVTGGTNAVVGVAGPALVITKWERKWEPALLSQARSRFIVLGPAACDLG